MGHLLPSGSPRSLAGCGSDEAVWKRRPGRAERGGQPRLPGRQPRRGSGEVASFFVVVRVPFFRTLMQIPLPLQRVPAFREVDEAGCMGGSTYQLPASCLGLAQLTMKCVQIRLDFT